MFTYPSFKTQTEFNIPFAKIPPTGQGQTMEFQNNKIKCKSKEHRKIKSNGNVSRHKIAINEYNMAIHLPKSVF